MLQSSRLGLSTTAFPPAVPPFTGLPKKSVRALEIGGRGQIRPRGLGGRWKAGCRDTVWRP